MPLPPALQNQKVQIGIIVAGLVVGLGFLLFQIIGSNQPPPEAPVGMGYGPPGMPGGMPPGGPGGPMGMPGGPAGSMMPGGPGGMPGGPGVGGYGSDTASAGGAAGGAAKPAGTKKAGPHPKARKDPFKTPTDELPEPVPVAERLPPMDLYVTSRQEELQRPTPEQYVRDVPDPPMRMAGALWGNRIYGVLEINGQTQVVNPGDHIGIYRVDRVERDRIILSRPSRKGRRQVEAQLTGNQALEQQYPTGDTGVPGGPPGYGGGAMGMPGPGGMPGRPPGG